VVSVSLEILLSHSVSFDVILSSRACTSSYHYSIVTTSLSYTVSEIFYSLRSLKFWVRHRARSVTIAPFDRSHTSSCWFSTATTALSCIVSEIKRNIGRKLRFSISPSGPFYITTPWGNGCECFCAVFFHNRARSLANRVL